MAGAIEFMSQVTPDLLEAYCDPDELYNPTNCTTSRFRTVYDPEIQRGAKDTKTGPKEFLREAQIESMMKDIENDQFECPQLMWNLRAGETTWAYLLNNSELRVYQGVATRPDTNHRHHAIIRFHKEYLRWVEQTSGLEMPGYNPNRHYGLVIYTDDYKGEAHRFYVYNFMGWRVPTSTAHYIESKTRTPAIHAKLARELMECSGILTIQNVEIISNMLSRNSTKMITFGTLTDALRSGFPALTEDEYGDLLEYLIKFLEQLNRVRPHEIAILSVAQRQRARERTVADQAVLWHGYIKLSAWLRERHRDDWKECLQVFAKPYAYRRNGIRWDGDLFDRENRLWVDRGLMVPGKNGMRVLNNRDVKRAAFEVLRDVIEASTSNGVQQSEEAVAT